MHTVILEDNELDLENLRLLLADFPWIKLSGTASTVDAGIELIQREKPDLVLLDIQICQDLILDQLTDLGCSPHIICVSLCDKHALKAFDINAVDYLLKPITTEKLRRALERIAPPIDECFCKSIAVRNGNTSHILHPEHILLISADGNYTAVLDSNSAQHLCSRRMRDWNELLPKDLFVSLDRSTIVNWKEIASFSRTIGLKSKLVFRNGQYTEIGATALQRLQTLFQ